MGDKKAKMLYADPPYCLLVRRNKKTGQLRDPKKAKINHEAVTRYENIKQYRNFTRAWLEKAVQYIEEDGVLCIWINFLGVEPIKNEASKLGWNFQGEFLWAKKTKGGSGNEFMCRVYEVALIFTKKDLDLKGAHAPSMCWSVISQYDEEGEAGEWENHPNHKPFTALEPLIRQFTVPGDRILDPFSGSGSTPAAALQLERKISAIELREQWAQISQSRITHMLSSNESE